MSLNAHKRNGIYAVLERFHRFLFFVREHMHRIYISAWNITLSIWGPMKVVEQTSTKKMWSINLSFRNIRLLCVGRFTRGPRTSTVSDWKKTASTWSYPQSNIVWLAAYTHTLRCCCTYYRLVTGLVQFLTWYHTVSHNILFLFQNLKKGKIKSVYILMTIWLFAIQTTTKKNLLFYEHSSCLHFIYCSLALSPFGKE